ncbi:MAG: hypothetical protein E7214_12710 [Clostridium sp.]|nr:hypothetical protein [Clostridium sp.]
MGKITSLFGKREKKQEENNNKEEKMIEFIDSNGKRDKMPVSKWREEVIPSKLKNAWDKPAELYDEILESIEGGFAEDVVEAAEHLREIDDIKERGATICAIAYMSISDFANAEKVLMRYIEEFGKTGIILTNLAKVYDSKGEKDKVLDTLWEGLNLEPNQDNGVAWYLAIHKESEGQEGYISALNKIAAIDGSWYANLLIAREFIIKKEIEEAKKIYTKVLEKHSTNSNVLITISSDLGQAGYIDEMISLIEPLFNINVHLPQVGLNLLNGYYINKKWKEGEELIRNLMVVPDPRLRDYLVHMMNEFEKIRRIPEVEGKGEDVKINLVTLKEPVWYYALKEPKWLIKEKENAKNIAIIPYVDLTKDVPIEGEVKNEDGVGTLTRTLPLYLSELINFKSEFACKVEIPYAEGFGPVVTTEDYTKDALKEICGQVKADKLITGNIRVKDTTMIITTYVYDSEKDDIKKIIYDCDEECFGEDFNDMVNDINSQLGKVINDECYYDLPSNDDVLVYLSSLGQHLTQTFVYTKHLDRNVLWAENDMFNWYFNMALSNPDNEIPMIMLASAIAKSKDYGSNMYKTVKKQAVGLFKSRTDNVTVKALMAFIYKLYDMEDEYVNVKEDLLKTTENEKIKNWIESL